MCLCCLRTHWHRFLSRGFRYCRGFRYWPGPTIALEAWCGAFFVVDVFVILLALFSSQRGGAGFVVGAKRIRRPGREIAKGRGQFLGISLGGRQCKELTGRGGSCQDKTQ